MNEILDILPLKIAILGMVYCVLLMEPGHLLDPLYKWTASVFKTNEREAQGKGKHWLFKILMDCERCFVGQVAFWVYLYKNFKLYTSQFDVDLMFDHIMFVSMAIVWVTVLKLIYKRWS